MSGIWIAVTVGAAFGLGFWLGGLWFSVKLARAIALGRTAKHRAVRDAMLRGGDR